MPEYITGTPKPLSDPPPAAIYPSTQTEVAPSVVADYANPGPGAAFWAPHNAESGVAATPPAGGIPEAPVDGQPYSRCDADWELAIEDAPSDGQLYARQNGAWVLVPKPGPWNPISFTNGSPGTPCAYRIDGDICRLKGTVQAQSGSWGTVSVETLPLPASDTVHFATGGLDDQGNANAIWQVMIWGPSAPTPGQLRLMRQLPDDGAGGLCSLDGIVYPV